MQKFLITCVVKNNSDDIIKVGLRDGRIFETNVIINDINAGRAEFYTITPGGREADVYAKPPNQRVNHWFLTTNRDGLLPNNLDNLRHCY